MFSYIMSLDSLVCAALYLFFDDFPVYTYIHICFLTVLVLKVILSSHNRICIEHTV